MIPETVPARKLLLDGGIEGGALLLGGFVFRGLKLGVLLIRGTFYPGRIHLGWSVRKR